MSPLRWDVLLVGFVLALPVLALGLRGDMPAEDVAMRLPWCLAAAWAAVWLLRAVATPKTTGGSSGKKVRRPVQLTDTTDPVDEGTPTA
jgi:hypothetical protein